MRKLYVIISLSLLSHTAISQHQPIVKKDFSIGAGLSLAIPARNLATNTLGGGLDVLGQYGLTEKLVATADVGLTALAPRFNIPTSVVIPARVGLRYFPAPNAYLSGKAGAAILTLGVVSDNYFAWALGAGYVINNRLDIAGAFEGFAKPATDFGYVTLRIGYTFKK